MSSNEKKIGAAIDNSRDEILFINNVMLLVIIVICSLVYIL